MKNECTKARVLMAAELDGDIASGQVAGLKRHLTLCTRCNEELARLRRSVALLEALPRPEPGAAFATSTLRKARLARQAQQVSQRWWTRFGSVAALALGAAALVALRVSGISESLAQWMLSNAPGAMRLADSIAVAAANLYDGLTAVTGNLCDSLAPFVRGLLLVLTDTLEPLLTLLARAGHSAWGSALPGYVLAILTLSLLAALSRSRAAAGPVQVEKMP